MARTGTVPVVLTECGVDPLLVGADREFLEGFPRKTIHSTGGLPIRRYRNAGLVVLSKTREGEKTLAQLQSGSDVRLLAVPAIHEYAIDLFLRYWEGGNHQVSPPLWLQEGRRSLVLRQADILSVTGRVQTAALFSSLLLTSPLASLSPVLVAPVGKEAHAIFLHGTAGLKVGARFPLQWLKGVLDRLRSEFEMEEGTNRVIQGKGKQGKGLEELTGLQLPPLRAPSFIIEPRVRR